MLRISWIFVGGWVGEGFLSIWAGPPFPITSPERIFKCYED